MKRKIIFIGVVSIIVYPLLLATFYLSLPFMASWGIPNPWYFRLIAFLENTPCSIKKSGDESMLGILFIDTAFWTFLIGMLLYLLLSVLTKHKQPTIH